MPVRPCLLALIAAVGRRRPASRNGWRPSRRHKATSERENDVGTHACARPFARLSRDASLGTLGARAVAPTRRSLWSANRRRYPRYVATLVDLSADVSEIRSHVGRPIGRRIRDT